jgi:hypothetical protein
VRDGFKRSRELVRGRFWLVIIVLMAVEIMRERGESPPHS